MKKPRDESIGSLQVVVEGGWLSIMQGVRRVTMQTPKTARKLAKKLNEWADWIEKKGTK